MATYQESEYPTIINTGGNGNNGFGWGGDGIWALLAIAILFGNNGFGGGFGGFGRGFGGFGLGNEFLGYQLGRTASQEDVASGFNNSAVLSGINGIKENQLSMQNFINQGFSGLSSQLLGEFRNIDNSICTLGYQQAQLVNNLSHQLSDCCCQTSRAIDGVNYNVATHFGQLNNTLCGLGRDIIENNNANYRALHDEIVANKIEAKNDRIAELQLQVNNLQLKASQEAQSAYLLSQLRDPGCPVASYNVPNPNCCYNPFGFTYGYANNNNNNNNCCGF